MKRSFTRSWIFPAVSAISLVPLCRPLQAEAPAPPPIVAEAARELSPVEKMKELEKTVIHVVSEAQPAVVNLTGGNSAGSGVVVTEDGLILTAAHVTKGFEKMAVKFHDGRDAEAIVLGSNFTRDIGMAKITTPGKWPHVKVGGSAKLGTSEIVIALGHPGGYDIRRPAPVRIGRISVTDAEGFLVSDCALVGGDSGGPLFNLAGEVVGIHSSIGGSISFNRHAPVDAARKDWDKLFAGQRWGDLEGRAYAEDQPVVGISPDNNASEEKGIRVKSILRGSPAETAGVRANDIVLKINGSDTTSHEQFIGEMRKARVGQDLTLSLLRDSEEMEIKVRPVTRKQLLAKQKEKPEPEEKLAREESAPAPSTPSEATPAPASPEEGQAKAKSASQPWLGLEMTSGPIVKFTKVDSDSPAAAAGIKVGDTLLAVNGRNVDHPSILSDFLKSAKTDQEVTLKVKTFEGEKTLCLKVAAR